ncbi:hypothetical protein D1872_349660 [compost metagenome]
MFKVISIILRAVNAMSKESGIEIMEIMVERILRRKSRMIRMANKAPKTALPNIVFTES